MGSSLKIIKIKWCRSYVDASEVFLEYTCWFDNTNQTCMFLKIGEGPVERAHNSLKFFKFCQNYFRDRSSSYHLNGYGLYEHLEKCLKFRIISEFILPKYLRYILRFLYILQLKIFQNCSKSVHQLIFFRDIVFNFI